jgi:DNA repair ATPase RecN
MARALLAEVDSLGAQRDQLKEQLERLGAFTVLQLEARRADLEREIAEQAARLERERTDAVEALRATSKRYPGTQYLFLVKTNRN